MTQFRAHEVYLYVKHAVRLCQRWTYTISDVFGPFLKFISKSVLANT